MMDVSDGLAKDLSRLCLASGVGARLDLGAVPVSPALRAAAPMLGIDALGLAIGGGEDYELLATLHPDDAEAARGQLEERFDVPLTVLGTIVEGGALVAVDAEGREAPLEATGWDHFA
jgi:thiamine-monophosphate kinase